MMLAQLPAFGLDQLGPPSATITAVGAVVSVAVLVILGTMIWRFQGRFVRRWESVDKRLSEVLWRTRHSDAEELRKRTVMLEEQLVDMLQYLRTVANTIDAQLEGLSNEMKSSLSKIDRGDSQTAGQSRMVIYQLERIRKQLNLLEDAGTVPSSSPKRTSAGGVSRRAGTAGAASQPDGGYRVEAVFEPIRSRIREAARNNAEVQQLLDELSWEKAG